jgi:RNA polymerase sigma-70 factor, ECF subfamily
VAAVWAGTGSLSGIQDADRRLRQRHGLCMSEEQTDEQLVALAQEGNARAFELLVRKYQYKIIQLVSRLVGESDAPDVAQETFIKAYRALNGFRGQSAFYTWLYRIGINTAKNHIVSRGRRPANQDIDIADAEQYGHTEHLSDVDTPESLLLSDEIKQKVAEVINKLPADLRQAITLRELEGLSYEEIAEVMDCPIGTVRSRIFRAREAIDAVVQPLLND